MYPWIPELNWPFMFSNFIDTYVERALSLKYMCPEELVPQTISLML